MKCRAIREDLLNLLLEIGRSQHPMEFVAILTARDGVIEELELVPGTVVGGTSAAFSPSMLPLNPGAAGSAHSHPNGVIKPSNADLRFFPTTGSVHLIIGYPYGPGDWRAFNADGTTAELEVIS